ncbi:SCP2 sterol-binding domain-containing protein [Streptomyces sp. DSM 44915]|uniref:SCP2 sterol-binding domain-containing protein n=1 Tax=Streptomyces chisholmiae TaxID=3075540 RepID=A0ABU2JN70_9ACTN|nr:SCP2 sterol-binding domain-containing protein [Streptomyces sp. DSM 44915]MDT0266431.1 SCP2 sterol-binding domain-containing protein [Streptomyces sp. DSM 44915]
MAENGPELSELDFAQVTPAEFASLVKRTPAREISRLLRGELRTRVLAEIFARMERQFRPDAAGSTHAVIRWEITGESLVVYETSIADGVCTVREGAHAAAPRVTLTMADPDFLKLVSGNGSPVTMFMTRKVAISGDIGFASGLTRLFDIPKA